MKKIGLSLLLSVSLFAGDVTVKLNVQGMTCPMCLATVKATILKVYGVKSASVSLKEGIATVVIDDRLNPNDIAQEVTKKGFPTSVGR